MNHEAADGGRAEDDSNMEPPPIDDDVDDDNATDTGSDDDENEEEDDDEEDTSSDDESVVIPTPDDVEHEFTYPQDFEGKSWEDVVPSGQYFRLILDPSCTNIPDGKFKGCGRLIEIVVPEDSCLRMIGISSFYWCTNLQRITNGLPTTLLIIDRSAFGCTALKGPLVIPSNVIRLFPSGRSSSSSSTKNVHAIVNRQGLVHTVGAQASLIFNAHKHAQEQLRKLN